MATLTREEATAILLEERLLITAFIATVAHNYHIAEDIFQDICVKSLSCEGDFQSREHLLNWARVTGKHRAINVLKSRAGRYIGLDDDALAALAAAWPDTQNLDVRGSREALARCLKNLTANNREIVRLRYYEGRTGSDVAEKLGRKLATVYQALARIHRMLGECIRTRMSAEGESL